MNGGTIVSNAGPGIVSGDWVVQGVEDFNGDRKADILWRNKNTGALTTWFMNGGTLQSQSGTWAASSAWVIQDSLLCTITLVWQGNSY